MDQLTTPIIALVESSTLILGGGMMSAIANDSASGEGHSQPTVGQGKSPQRVLLVALGWCVVAEIVSGVPVGAASAILRKLRVQEAFGSSLTGFIAMFVLASCVLLIAARRQAVITGDGDFRRGIGDAPISKQWLLIILALLGVVYAFVATSGMFGLAPQAVQFWRAQSNGLLFVFSALVTFLPPIAEELFFRGWLWTALRQQRGTFTTAILTGGLFLLVHLDRGILWLIFLIPVAVNLSLARHFCGLRGAVVIHSLNDLVSALTTVLIASSPNEFN